MNTNSTPKFVDVGNGNIKIVLSNFSGELIAREIIGLTRYTGCPIPSPPKQPNEPVESKRSPSGSDKPKNKVGGADKERNASSQPPVEEGIDYPDQEDTSSVNLLEDSGGSDEDTVYGLAQTNPKKGLDVSVADDDDIEYEPELSQQVCYWKY